MLRVNYPGRFFLFDVSVDVFLDGQAVGKGYLKKGVQLTIPTNPGAHTLELKFFAKSKSYTVVLAEPGDYEVRPKYSALVGGFADQLEIIAPSGTVAGPAQAAVGGVSNRGRFFTCLAVNTGSLGLAEGMQNEVALVGPALRKATVTLQESDLVLSCADANGQFHDTLQTPVHEITRVSTQRVSKQRQLGYVLVKAIGGTFAVAGMIAVGVGAQVGFEQLLRDIQRHPMILVSVGGLVILFAAVVSLFAVFLPNVLKIRQSLTRINFHAENVLRFAVLVTAAELKQARETLGTVNLVVGETPA